MMAVPAAEDPDQKPDASMGSLLAVVTLILLLMLQLNFIL